MSDGSGVSQRSTGASVEKSDHDQCNLSIVLPTYNERENVGPLAEEIQAILAEMEPDVERFEIIFIDDGSTDGTREILRDLANEHDELIAVCLRRNFGQSAALAAGIDAARGDVIVTMDSDRQNDPRDIPRLISKLEEGYDCVSGWRKERNDPLRKRIPSRIQTYLAQLTGPNIHDFGCTLKAYRSNALEEIDLYGEGHRYIPAQLHKQGFRITEIEVNHRPRTHGQTKYGFKRLLKGFTDLLFVIFWNRYSTRPLHLLGGLGFLMMFAGSLIGAHAVFIKYAFDTALVPRTPRLILTIGLVLFGFQMIMFGFIAEMLTKLYYRSGNPYRIKNVIN